MTTLTIQLDDRTGERLLELSRREHKKPEIVAVEAVRRSLFVDWFEAANAKYSDRAAKQGFLNEEELIDTAASKDTEKIVLPPGARMTKLVKRMIDNPFHAPGFMPLTREEIHDRERDRREIH